MGESLAGQLIGNQQKPFLDLVEEYQPPSQEEIDLLINHVVFHPLRLLKGFLQEHQLPTSGIKESIHKRITEAVADGKVAVTELIELLNDLEGWGNQHIYLYRSNRAAQAWDSEQKVQAILKKNNLLHLFNRRNPVVLPAKAHISSIRHTAEQVRIQWIEKREWRERTPEYDKREGRRFWQAYLEHTARGITTFDWDLLSGHAALMIRRLPTGSDYDEVCKRFEKELEPLVGISGFQKLKLTQSIRKIEESKEVRRRQYRHETIRGGVASFTSRSRSRDAFEDPDLARARDALGKQTLPLHGNYYWLPVSGRLDREVHVKVYAKDERVGIFGACTEEEVRYLLSRVRYYTR